MTSPLITFKVGWLSWTDSWERWSELLAGTKFNYAMCDLPKNGTIKTTVKSRKKNEEVGL